MKGEIKESEVKGIKVYHYLCEDCGKEIVSTSRPQLNSWAEVHELKHKVEVVKHETKKRSKGL